MGQDSPFLTKLPGTVNTVACVLRLPKKVPQSPDASPAKKLRVYLSKQEHTPSGDLLLKEGRVYQ